MVHAQAVAVLQEPASRNERLLNAILSISRCATLEEALEPLLDAALDVTQMDGGGVYWVEGDCRRAPPSSGSAGGVHPRSDAHAAALRRRSGSCSTSENPLRWPKYLPAMRDLFRTAWDPACVLISAAGAGDSLRLPQRRLDPDGGAREGGYSGPLGPGERDRIAVLSALQRESVAGERGAIQCVHGQLSGHRVDAG